MTKPWGESDNKPGTAPRSNTSPKHRTGPATTPAYTEHVYEHVCSTVAHRGTINTMSTPEYGIQRLIPPWSTNPDLPAGQPYPGNPGRVEGRYLTRSAAESACERWEPGTWRVMVRDCTNWRQAT